MVKSTFPTRKVQAKRNYINMALTFGQSKGSAIKNSIKSFAFKDGDNTLRIVGDIIPRYVYWIEGTNGKNIPMECLSFDREAEAFINREKDWVREFHPNLKCSWAYVTQCISNGEILVVNLKKKLWEQVITAAEDLGDPTDYDTGWDLKVLRKKTGPLAFNVEYQLQSLKCKTRSLTDEEREVLKDLKSMDEVMARPTPDAQKELLDRISGVSKENQDDESLEQEFAT